MRLRFLGLGGQEDLDDSLEYIVHGLEIVEGVVNITEGRNSRCRTAPGVY